MVSLSVDWVRRKLGGGGRQVVWNKNTDLEVKVEWQDDNLQPQTGLSFFAVVTVVTVFATMPVVTMVIVQSVVAVVDRLTGY